MIRVTVWNENIHEKEIPEQMAHYPRGIHGAIAEYLQKNPDELDVRIATQDQPACGLPDDVLNTTDVMIWWGHAGHHLVPDDLARRVADRVLLGMGLIVLHSGHYSKPFRLLMGTTCSLRCRDGDYERLWCVDPGHPIAKGIPMNVELPMEEMYGEFFDIPRPDELVFAGWFRGGELFRSGCCWRRGAGKIFYFQPGHETNPVYCHPDILKIIGNAVRWAAPDNGRTTLDCYYIDGTTESRVAKGLPIDQY